MWYENVVKFQYQRTQWFLPCDAMLARVLAVVVCPSVRQSHAGIVSKQLIVGSRKGRHTLPQRL